MTNNSKVKRSLGKIEDAIADYKDLLKGENH
jgi:hypothetical protein